MILSTALDVQGPWGLDPVLFEIGWFKLRWYSLAYLAGIIAAGSRNPLL